MGLPFGIWPIFIGLIWVAEALPTGGLGNSLQLRNPQHAIGMAGNPPASDEILNINQELIPPEAPESSFLLEGDIVKVSPFRVFSSASPKWPKRRGTVQIPYIISYKYDKPSVKIIKEAFADFAKFTCVKFVPYSYQRDFVSIMPMSGCFSSVGRTGGMQVVSLAPACLRRGKGVTLHELMHVVGFWHEHSRADRDKYISISWNEILTGFEINFMKSWNSNMLVNYDYSSVMHYGRYAFSMTGLPTIVPLSDPSVALGQRWNLSSSDIARVNKLYKCSLTEPESSTESTSQETITDFLSNELEPCPTEGENKVSTPSPTAGASSPGTKPPETVQSARRPSRQMTSAPRAGTEELMGRTAMDGEGLGVSLAERPIMELETFEPTRLSTHGMTYLETTGKSPPPHMEMGTLGAERKTPIPTEETSLLGTESIKEPNFTTVTAPPLGLAWLSEVTNHHGKAAEGLGTTKIPTDALSGLEFPELVSPATVAPVETRGTRLSDMRMAETKSIQGTELAYHSTYMAQKGPSPATEVGVVTLSSNQTPSLEIQTELATAEITSPSEESLGTYTAVSLSLGPIPPEQVSVTETSHPTSTEKWTTNLARLLSAKSITTRTRSAPSWETPSVETETLTVRYATEETSLRPPVQNWTSSPTKQGNWPASSQAYSPGSHEQSTLAIPTSGITEIEPTEEMQLTSLSTSFEMVQNHTIHPVEIGMQGATTRQKKGTVLSSSGIETSYLAPPTKATTSMETQTELGFVEATKIKASYPDGSPSLTEGTYIPVTKVKDAKCATEAETLPVDWGSQASEPAEIGMQATKTNYRDKERVHINTLFPVGGTSPTAIGPTHTTPSLGASENPITNLPNAQPAESTRSETRNQAIFFTRRSPEMGVQEASNIPPNRRRGLTYTPASVLTSSTATELGFMEHPTREASGLETPVAQVSRPSEMVTTGVSPAWTEAKDQFSSSGTREATFIPMSRATEKLYSTQINKSPESASLPEVEIKEHSVSYRMEVGLVTLTPPQSRPRTALVPSIEMPKLTVPEKLTPVHTEPTTNQAQTGIKNTSPSLIGEGEMPSLQMEPTKTAYPTEGPSQLQASPQTFGSIEQRLKTSSKQQMHAAVSSGESLTPLEGIPTASMSACELCHSTKALSTQASETPTWRSEEAKGKTFPLPMGTTLPAENKSYMNTFAMEFSESPATELQTTEASLAQPHHSIHVEGTSFHMANPSEAVNTPQLATSETPTTHSILPWEPVDQVEYRKQMTWFPKTSPLNAEHSTKRTSLEDTAESGLVETTGTGMEAEEHGSPGERTSPALSEAPEVTFPPETSTTNSAEMGIQEAISTPRKRSRWVSHTAHSVERISLAATEPTYVMVPQEPGNPTISTEPGNQLRLSISSSRTEMGAQGFRGEPKKEGRSIPTVPSAGRIKSREVAPSLKSKVVLLQESRLRKSLFPWKQTQPFLGMKSTESVKTTEESPLLTEIWQLHQAQTGTNAPAMLSLRTEQATGAHPAREETSLPPPQLTPASPKSNKLISYRATPATSLSGEEAAPSILAVKRAPSTRTTNSSPQPLEESRTSHPVERGVQEAESHRKKGSENSHALARECLPAGTELSCKMVLAAKATGDEGMGIATHMQGTEGKVQHAAPATEGMLPVDTETTEGLATFSEVLGTQTTNAVEVGIIEAPSSPRKGGRGEMSRLTPTGMPAAAVKRHVEPSKVMTATGHLETQTISCTELATMMIPFSQRKSCLTTEETNSPMPEVVYGPFLEALTKPTTQAVLGLQGVQKSPRKQGRVSISAEGTKATHVMPSLGPWVSLETNPSSGTANTTSMGASLHNTSPVLSISTEMNGQEATSSHGPRKGGHPYAATPAGTWPVTRESEHRGHPTKGTLVQKTQSNSPHREGATETTSTQARAPNLSNTEEGTPIADTATEVMRSTRVMLLLEAPENKAASLREVAIKEETSSHREEGGLSTTQSLPSGTLSTETAEQVQSTQANEQMLSENWPTSHPEQGTGKPTTNTTQTGGENTHLPSRGGGPSLEAVTHWFDLAEGTSQGQASPHQTFSPTELQIETLSSQETPAMILHREEYGQNPMSPEGTQPTKTEALELLGLFTKTVSMQSPETPTQRLEVSVFDRKRGHGKPSPLSIETTLSAENETYMASSPKIALGMEALTGQTELGTAEVSLAQLLSSSTPAEGTSFPGAEATEAGNKVPSNGTETQTIRPGETRELMPMAKTPSAGTEATGQSYSTTVKAAETLSSPSERRGYTATGSYRKKNGEQAYTLPIGEWVSSAGSDITHASPLVWHPYYQTSLVSTVPVKTPFESGAPSPLGGIPPGEVEPTYIGSSLETQTASPPAGGNGGKYVSISREIITPVGHRDLGNEISALEQHSSLSEKWAFNTTKLANGELPTLQAQVHRENTTTRSAAGVMPTPGTKEAHSIKAIQLKQAFQKDPSDLFSVDPELLHLVGKRSLPDAEESPAPPHDSNPDLKVITLTHGHQKMQSPLLSNTLEKLRAKVLEAFQKQHALLPEFQVSPVTGLYPAAKEIRSVPWWLETRTSDSTPDRKHGLLKPRELLFTGRKKATSQTPFLLSAKAVQAPAPPAVDQPTAAPPQSGSGKRAHHSLSAQRATVQPGWQFCDFEKDLCSWQQSDTDDFDWILAGERPSARSEIGNLSEEIHYSPSRGGYISLKSPSARQTTGHKTSLISPILHRIGCIHFWYSPLGSAMGTINIYIKLADAPEWHRIWSAEGQQGTDWHQVGVEASESQKLQVMVEGVIGPDAGSDVGIDDLSVCVAECQRGCDELIALYKKGNEQQTK
ncbi:astacin-like metalloendopeptidase isoform X2 [Dermochelys coriacea]|uniref:astacin-like metalloendopeptidase isoform X2 n=1 Tax=Dermochelys coriacea TaxID=27794 RepID=UPI001CA84014|nr:astacin-like metalloendopeptidase isoform X2 [Dermochelys coriacea]